jgi:hypothetical protein
MEGGKEVYRNQNAQMLEQIEDTGKKYPARKRTHAAWSVKWTCK